MRIGLVCPYDLSKPGGVQAQVLGLRNALGGGLDEVFVIGPGLPDDVDGWDLGGTVGVRGNGSVAPISLDPRTGKAIRAASRELDVLHVHEPFMPAVSLSALRAGSPVLGTFHAAATGIGRLFYKVVGTQAKRLLGPHLRRVTAVSKTAAASLPPGLDPVIIPNGVAISAFGHKGRRDKRVVFLGRDEPRKGLDVLLDAWPIIADGVPGAELVVMGCDRATPGIKWMGVVDDETKVRVLGTAAVYVAPNTGSESFGIILVEGMAAGAAVVASDLDAFIDVGGNAVTYFKTGDARSLAETVIDLLRRDEKRGSLSEAGRWRAVEFDWSTVAAKYRALYDEVVS